MLSLPERFPWLDAIPWRCHGYWFIAKWFKIVSSHAGVIHWIVKSEWVTLPQTSLNVQNPGQCFLQKMLYCILFAAIGNQPVLRNELNASGRQCARVQLEMPGEHCRLRPSSSPGTRWVFKNRRESSEARTCTSQRSSYYW